MYLTEDGTREIVGPGYEDLRFFLIAMADPFDLIGLMMGRNRTKEFWKVNENSEEHGAIAVNGAVGGKDSDIEKAVDVKANGFGAGSEDTEETVNADENSGCSKHGPEHV